MEALATKQDVHTTENQRKTLKHFGRTQTMAEPQVAVNQKLIFLTRTEVFILKFIENYHYLPWNHSRQQSHSIINCPILYGWPHKQ